MSCVRSCCPRSARLRAVARGTRACKLRLGSEEWKIPIKRQTFESHPDRHGSTAANGLALSSFQFCPEELQSLHSLVKGDCGFVTCPQGLALALCPEAASVMPPGCPSQPQAAQALPTLHVGGEGTGPLEQ